MTEQPLNVSEYVPSLKTLRAWVHIYPACMNTSAKLHQSKLEGAHNV